MNRTRYRPVDNGYEIVGSREVFNRTLYGSHANDVIIGVLPGLEEIRVPNRSATWRDVEAVDAMIASRFIDPKNRLHVGSTVFENGLGNGGRPKSTGRRTAASYRAGSKRSNGWWLYSPEAGEAGI
jgi:hypothetical protein